MKKIVILYAEYGAGHKSVTQNLEKLLDNYEIVAFNARKENNKSGAKITEYMYNDFVSKNSTNPIVKNGYHLSYKIAGTSRLLGHMIIKRSGYKFIDEMLQEEKPDLLILTFPYYVQNVYGKTLTIVTDYVYHKTWDDKKMDYYFVGTEEIRELWIDKGVPESKIFATGIPLSPEFNLTKDSKELKNILFNLGARGQTKLEKVKNWIDHSLSLGLNVSVLCGKNEDIHEGLKVLYEDQIKAYGYTDEVARILSENDLVVTKAGGLSVTEAIMTETPMIINLAQSLKGQEKENYEFIEDMKIGVNTKEKNLEKTIEMIVNNPEKYQEMAKNIKKVKIFDQDKKIKETIDWILEDDK